MKTKDLLELEERLVDCFKDIDFQRSKQTIELTDEELDELDDEDYDDPYNY